MGRGGCSGQNCELYLLSGAPKTLIETTVAWSDVGVHISVVVQWPLRSPRETPLVGEADDSVRRPVCNTEDENCLQSNMDHRPTATGRKSRARQRRRMRDNDCVKHDQEPHSRDAQNEELKDRRRERRPSGTESPSKKKHDAINNTRTQANPRTRTCKNRAVARASPMPTKCSDGNPRHQPQMAKPSARQPLTSPFHNRNPSSHRAAPQPTGRPGRCTLAKTRTTHTLSP